MTVYADTSLFVSLYLPNRHTAKAVKRLQAKVRLPLTPLHRAEWIYAVAQHVFRNEITELEAEQVYGDFDRDDLAGIWDKCDLPQGAFEKCMELARSYGARLGVRTLDTLHVASAIELGSKRFWTFDDRQAKLAKAAGLTLV